MGYEQVVNSIPMRMAILHAILNNNDLNIENPWRKVLIKLV
jgi:hypothetical protein